MKEEEFLFMDPISADDFADWCDAHGYDNDLTGCKVCVECPDDEYDGIVAHAAGYGGATEDALEEDNALDVDDSDTDYEEYDPS